MIIHNWNRIDRQISNFNFLVTPFLHEIKYYLILMYIRHQNCITPNINLNCALKLGKINQVSKKIYVKYSLKLKVFTLMTHRNRKNATTCPRCHLYLRIFLSLNVFFLFFYNLKFWFGFYGTVFKVFWRRGWLFLSLNCKIRKTFITNFFLKECESSNQKSMSKLKNSSFLKIFLSKYE